MKKTLIAISLVVAIGMGAAAGDRLGKVRTVEAAAKPVFSDISGHWAASSIETAVKAGILNGYANGTFKPNNAITRAELMKVLALTFGLEPAAAAGTGSAWYAPYQKALTDAKIYMSGDFPSALNNPVTREEMSKVAVRGAYTDYRGKTLTANELMFRAVNAGLLSRTGTKAETIDAKGTTTRAQAAVLVTRLLKLKNGGTLTVDQGASSAAEIAWHRHNMITMFKQDDLVKFPYSIDINTKYNVTFDQLIVIDPADKTGFYAEYLDGATYSFNGKAVSSGFGYIFAYKFIGKNIVVESTEKVMETSFYMYTAGNTGSFNYSDRLIYNDGKLIDRTGLYINSTALSFKTKNNSGYNFRLEYVSKDYVQSQIKQYGGVPIHLERFGGQLDKASQFYLTEVKDKYVK